MADQAAAYQLLEQEITEARLRHSPALATAAGRHDWDGELGELSEPAMQGRARELAAQIRRLDSLDHTALPEPYRTRAPIHLRKLRFERSEIEQDAAYRHNPGAPLGVIGYGVNSLMIREFAPLAERMQSLASRLSQVPRYLAEARQVFDRCTPIHAETAIQQGAGVLSLLERDVPALAAGVSDAAIRSRVEEAATAAATAAGEYVRWLRDGVQPAATAPVAWGLARMERLVSWQEYVDASIDTIIRRGEEDLRHQQQRLRDVAAQVLPGGTVQEAVRSVARDHPAAGELLPFTEQTLERLRQFCIDRDLIDMPTDVRVTLRETPGFSRATTLAACSTPGIYERVATEAFYYVTPPDSGWDAERSDQYLQFFSRTALPLITAHEAYPGHYVHLSWLRRLPDQVLGTNSTTTIEGWAHYTEQLMIEAGWGDGDPRVEIMQLREALMRLCRYLAAFGMHVRGWTYQDAVAFFEREALATRPVAELESRRGVVSPNYFAYTLGKHEILALREALRARWKSGFTLKRFHNAFVQEPYPTAVIAARLLAEG